MSATGPGERPEVGSLAEEATALLGALSGWVRDSATGTGEHAETGASDAAGPTADADQQSGDHDCTCRSCPLCRVVSIVRQVNPEVRQHLLDAGTSLLAAVAGLMQPPAQPSADTAGPRVARIFVEDEPDTPQAQ